MKNQLVKDLVRFGALSHLHLQEGPLPGAEDEFGRFTGVQGRGQFPIPDGLDQAAGEPPAHAGNHLLQLPPESFVLVSHLQGEITNGSAAFIMTLGKSFGHPGKKAAESLEGRQGGVLEKSIGPSEEVFGVIADALEAEILLALEIKIEGAFGDFSRLQDFLEAGVIEAVLQHDPGPGL